MYRPTVRYADVFRDYIDKLYEETTLDRNQIIRAALFTAAHTKEFQKLLSQYKKANSPLTLPNWRIEDSFYWLEQNPLKETKEVNELNHLVEDRIVETESLNEKKLTPREKTEAAPVSLKPSQKPREAVSTTNSVIKIRNQGFIKLTL